MLIRKPGLQLVKDVARALAAASAPRPWRALSLSWQDIIATDEELAEIFTPDVVAHLPIRSDSAEILNFHKATRITSTVPDWCDALRVLGFDPLVTDIVQARGCERYLDLNQPIPVAFIEAFDLVIDNVSNQCFDISQALRNITKMPKVGGYILHITPLAMINHGFFLISPTLFADFYAINGYEIVTHLKFDTTRDGRAGEAISIGDPTRRMRDVSLESMQLVLAKRTAVVRPARIPVQTKFQNHPRSIREDNPGHL